MRFVLILFGLLVLASQSYAGSTIEGNHKPDILTLTDAISTALEKSPQLQAQRASRSELEADSLQAGLMPNPEIALEAAQIAGQGSYQGTKRAEFSAAISQQIEIGGKRAARSSVADKAIALSDSEKQSLEQDIKQNVTIAYFEAVAAQEKLILAQDQLQLAQEAYDVVRRRVDAAREPVLQKMKADVALANARLVKAEAEKQMTAKKQQLLLLLGAPQLNVILDKTAFDSLVPPPPLAALDEQLTQTSDYQRFAKERERGEAVLALEKTAAIPDPRVSVGITDFRETEEQALMVGVSIPLPVFNRNQGAIAKAGHSLTRLDAEQRQVLQKLNADLYAAWQEMGTAYTQARSLQQNILPQAKRAYAESQRGYQLGGFSYLEVLDAQRTLADTRLQHISLISAYHQAKARVDRLTGGFSSVIQP